jgi:hypothetical protein
LSLKSLTQIGINVSLIKKWGERGKVFQNSKAYPLKKLSTSLSRRELNFISSIIYMIPSNKNGLQNFFCKPLINLVGRARFELATNGLKEVAPLEKFI